MSDAFQFGLKVAEIMLPGAQPQNPGMGLSGLAPSSSLPPITGPLRDDFAPGSFSTALVKSMDTDPLTGVDPRMKSLMDANDQQVHTNALQVAEAPHLKIQQEFARRQAEAAAARQRAQASVNAWANQSSPNDPLAFSFPTRQELKDTLHVGKEMARGFVEGLHPDVNPVTGGVRGTYRFFKNVGQLADNANNFFGSGRRMLEELEAKSKQPPTDPAALAAAQAAPKPTMGNYLSGSMASNPLWMLPAAGLGGLGIYGLYKLMNARRDAKKRRRLMSPAAITY